MAKMVGIRRKKEISEKAAALGRKLRDVNWSTNEVFRRVSETDLQFLIQSGDDASRVMWNWGDMANKWVAEGLPAMWVYRAVGELIGKRITSVRTYAYIARKFDDDKREEYGILRFEHFRFALTCDEPMAVLDYAIGVADERGGKPASVDELRGVFKGTRTLKIDDEEPLYVAGGALPAWGIPVARKIHLIADPIDRERIKVLFAELVIEIERVTNRVKQPKGDIHPVENMTNDTIHNDTHVL